VKKIKAEVEAEVKKLFKFSYRPSLNLNLNLNLTQPGEAGFATVTSKIPPCGAGPGDYLWHKLEAL